MKFVCRPLIVCGMVGWLFRRAIWCVSQAHSVDPPVDSLDEDSLCRSVENTKVDRTGRKYTVRKYVEDWAIGCCSFMATGKQQMSDFDKLPNSFI